jgi:hypothetical protein
MARFFLEPANPTHRQYEALRAYFVDHLPSAEAAQRFGYSAGSFRVWPTSSVKSSSPLLPFPQKGPQASPKTDRSGTRLWPCESRISPSMISWVLGESGQRISAVAVSLILKKGLPGCPEETKNDWGPGRVAEVADVNRLDLSPRQFRTQFGGLYLFVPYLAQIPLRSCLRSGVPGTKMIPAAQAIRSLLGLNSLEALGTATS